MTGVEAVSNGVTAFAAPAVRNARRTLTAIVVVLVLLLAGIAYLSNAYHIGATEPGVAGYQSVLSQLVAAVVGRGVFYYVCIGAVLWVLALSANTGFADFPRLCRLIAEAGFLPRIFASRGRRLVYSYGIYALSALSASLLIIFGGVTDRLIPLFAVGAFLAFTLSQAGMKNVWFFTSYRFYVIDTQILGLKRPDGSPEVDVNHQSNFLGKVTAQVNPDNRLMVQYYFNYQNRFFRRDNGYSFTEEKASWRQIEPANLIQGQWTAVLGKSLFLDARYGFLNLKFPLAYQSAVQSSDISKIDDIRSTVSNAAIYDFTNPADRHQANASLSYHKDRLAGMRRSICCRAMAAKRGA